ncbi:putative oxidoreductase [Lachnellula hyalina]|uniref:Putative oxidoreductase n=1 Tax=Lachnellula hyalina TaxID=1316788 RepID=A0A8H8TX61_9HELO|nr:putative oxidoreductase [Lachnellula hyalina]TVY22631.1 putative oxidoreductase [Lachnellula hyalina]
MALPALRNLRKQWFPPAPQFTDKNVPPQKGKVFIVTGGNAGVGYALIKLLYPTGATIYMASRSKERAEKAIAELEASTPASETLGKIKFLHLDLNDLLSVKAAAEEFAKQETRLDILWNNAGIGANNVTMGAKTAQGLDVMFGVHVVASLLFTNLLVPQLKAASTGGASARVVWTSSFLAEGMTPPNGIDLALLDEGYPHLTKNYAISKAGNWMVGREFAKRYGKDGIISVIQNPGGLKTNMYAGVPAVGQFFINMLLNEPIYGAYTNLYAAFSPDISLANNGAYVIPWGRLHEDKDSPRKDIIKAMTDEEKGGLGYPKKVWEYCESKWVASGVWKA